METDDRIKGSSPHVRARTLLWESCSEQVKLQVELFTSLDSKAGILIGFVAAALGEILAALIISADEHGSALSQLPRAGEATFVLSIVCIVVATCSAVIVLWPRKIHTGIDIDKTRKAMKAAEDEKRDSALGEEVRKVEAGYKAERALVEACWQNEITISRKARGVLICAASVGLAVILLCASVVSLVFVNGINKPEPIHIELLRE
jgi:hypothetical protein